MKKFKKIFSLILVLSTMLSLTVFSASAAEADVAKIGDTTYATLKDAVGAANAMESGATITLLADEELGEKLTISRNITINGAKTITRADAYTGTLFTVAAGATLTLGDVTIDGGNEWTFLLDEYMSALHSAEMIPDNAANAHNRFVALENSAPVSNAAVFAVSGNLVLNAGTVIQNHALANGDGKNVLSVAAGGTVTMNGPVLKHNTKIGSRTLMDVSVGGTCFVNNAEITDNFGFGNGCIASTYGNLYVNDIDFHANYGTSNGMFRVYGSAGYMEVNGGNFYGNFMVADANNNWNGMVYVHNSGATFVMNDGSMTGNYTTECGGVSAKQNGTSTIIINGGTIKENVVSTGRFLPGIDMLLGNPLEISAGEFVDSGRVKLYNDFINNGTLNADIVSIHGWANIKSGARVYSGEGTINGDVYLHGGAKTTMESGVWNGLVTVDDVDTATSLTVKPGATIKGVQIRVLNSVDSGDYLNAEEASAVQQVAYVQEAGANVTSPVLYYHRLTSAQKNNIVVTFDYNGGLDAQGWSGCQLTGAEAFVPVTPTPTKAGLKLIGWKYAVDNNPECLTMEGTTDYAGEAISQSVRLIAQWGLEEQKVTINFVDNDGNVLAPQEIQILAVGSNYETTAKEIPGYQLTSHTGEISGTITNEDVVVTYIYTEIYVPVHTPGSIVVTNNTTGDATPANASFQLQKLDGDTWINVGAPVAYSNFVNNAYTFTELEEGTYRVMESGAAVDGFTLTTAYSENVVLTKTTADNGDTSVNSGEFSVTNTYVVIEEDPTEPEATEPEETEPEETEPEDVIEIPEEDVPLASAPVEEEKDDLVEIPDEEPPLADVPKTGDMILQYSGMAITSGVVAILVGKTGKKNCKKEEDEE